MTLHVCILGIDGSGKSTVVAALPALLAAELGTVTGSAGDEIRIVGPDQDHLAPRFYPERLPIAAGVSLRLKRIAKRLANRPALYPVAKLAQMLAQDSGILALVHRYTP